MSARKLPRKKRAYVVAKCLGKDVLVAVQRALKYRNITMRQIRILLKNIYKKDCRVLEDRACRSGILLGIPNAIPPHVLGWKYIKRVVELHYANKELVPYEHFYLYICFDDIKDVARILPKAKSRGFRELDQMQNLIGVFSALMARFVRTEKPVPRSKRADLISMIQIAVYDTIKKWKDSVEGGGHGLLGNS